MNEGQAIKILKEEKSWESDDRKIAAFTEAINALEKQVPRKPFAYKNTNRADCPVCGATVRGITKFGDYCSKCGQRLEWEE